MVNPIPATYVEKPIPIPLRGVGYNSPANGYIIRNDAEMVNLENKNNTKVSVTASETHI